MPGPTKIGKNRETIWVFERGHCKPIGKNRETISEKNFSGKNRETILGEIFFDFFSGNIGKRYWFSKVVTVNRSGKIGKRFGENFFRKFFGKYRETTSILGLFPAGKTGKQNGEPRFRGVFPGRTPPPLDP